MADFTIKKWSGSAWVDAHPETTVGQLVTTGTPSSSTFLRGDGAWATPAGTTFNGGTITNPLTIQNNATDDTLLIKTTDNSSTAAPVMTFMRDSLTPADGDYLGQLKFKAKDDANQETVMAKITAKISDVTNLTEDGLLEFANRKAGSTTITARLTSTDLKLINGTGLQVDGDVGIGTTSPAQKLDVAGTAHIGKIDIGAGTFQNRINANGDQALVINSNGSVLSLNADVSDNLILVNGGGDVGIGTTSPAEKLDVNGNIIVSGDNRYMTFGTPGAGTTTGARFFSIEGNTDTSGEGSGRIFFTEHNSSTGAMDNYGMSLGYRGGASSIVGASGNTWSGLSQIGNGQWGMWGHNNSAAGALVMSGDRAATYIDLHNNELRNIGNANIFDTYRRDTIDSASEDFDDYITSGTYAVSNWSQSGDVVANGPTNTSAGNAYAWGMLRVTNYQSSTGDASGYVVQEYIPHAGDVMFMRFQWNGSWTNWRNYWGNENDGAGSNLDADLLDGQHGSYYTGYTDTAISNLVASAPGTLDTLNELAAAINDDASFASTITTQLTGKAKRIDLSNQVQLTSYRKSVIALCNVDNSVISRDSWSGGTIYFHRTNGLTAPVTAQITMEKRYNATGANYTAVVMSGNSFGDNIQYVTFDYNGNTYGGIEFFFSNAELAKVYFIGESNFDIFGLDYYNTQTSTVLNSEVNNSISTSNMTAETDFFFNNQKIFHSGNDGSTSGLDAQYFNGIPHTSFLRSDATDTATGALTLSNTNNHYSGHHYFDAYDANGNHYPHYLNGSNNNGAQVNMRVYNSSGQPSVFFIDGDSDDMTWRGNKIWNAGNDGPSSGLNADLLDNLHASSFLQKTGGTMSGNIVFSDDGEGIEFYGDNAIKKVSGTGMVITTDSTRALDILLQLERGAGGTKYKVWHEGNDGTGSGLSADNLRGYTPQESAAANSIAKRNGDGDLTVTDLSASKVVVTSTNPILQLTDLNTSGSAYIDYQGGTSLKVHAGSDPIVFIAGNSEKARLTAGNGFLGLGTTNPQASLHIVETTAGNDLAKFRNDGDTADVTIKTSGEVGIVKGGAGDQLQLSANGTDNNGIRITTAGNVGIGDTSPQGKLTVEQNMTNGGSAFSTPHLALNASNTTDNTGFVGMTLATSTADNYGWSYGAQRTSSGIGDLRWRNHSGTSAGNDRMILTSGGNLGVGVSSPSYAVDVSGDVNVTGNFKINGANLEASGNTWTLIKSGSTTISSGTAVTNVSLGSNTVDDTTVLAFELCTGVVTSYTSQIFIVKLEDSDNSAAGILYNAGANSSSILTGSIRVFRTLSFGPTSTSISFTDVYYHTNGSSSETADTVYVGNIWKLGVTGS